MSKTLVNLSDDVAVRLGDSAASIWTAAELKSYVKEGYDELCLSTLMLWKRAAVVLVAGTGTYTLATDLYKVDRITWQSIRIDPWTARESRDRNAYYRTTQGNVYAYVQELDGLGTIRLINVPAASSTTDLYVEYFRRGATLSADGTALEIPDRYTDYVVWYAMARALERDGRGQDTELAAHYQGRYLEGLKRIKKRKSQIHSSRIGQMGGMDGTQREPGYPQWPSNYGVPVRVRY